MAAGEVGSENFEVRILKKETPLTSSESGAFLFLLELF
jgi:hypothetical protein